MSKQIIASAIRTFAASSLGPGYTITVTAQAYQLGGNQHPHFSVTAEVRNPLRKDDCESCGCLHEEAARFWPAIRPIITLHLSNADDGEPMHATANGFYDLAGGVGHHFGEEYHRGSDKSHWSSAPLPLPPTNSKDFRLGSVITMVQPHPFHITDKHFPKHGSPIDPDLAPCGFPGCRLKPAEHVSSKVLQVVVTNRPDDLNAIPGLNDYLNQIKPMLEGLGIAGISFPTHTQEGPAETEYRLPTETECLQMCADHLRVSLDEVEAARDRCLEAFRSGCDSVASSEVVSAVAQEERIKAGRAAAKAVFAEYCDTLRPQWKAEAAVGIAIIQALSKQPNP